MVVIAWRVTHFVFVDLGDGIEGERRRGHEVGTLYLRWVDDWSGPSRL